VIAPKALKAKDHGEGWKGSPGKGPVKSVRASSGSGALGQ